MCICFAMGFRAPRNLTVVSNYVGGWELNQGPLEKQSVLLTTEPNQELNKMEVFLSPSILDQSGIKLKIRHLLPLILQKANANSTSENPLCIHKGI